jgi:ATP-dependent exoDNAse (exonuclease V) beta subunit
MSHISFSELKIWNECPWKHKLAYIDKIDSFAGNEHTAFGTAIHSVCEQLVENNISNAKDYFQEQFIKELKNLPEDMELNKKLIVDMRSQGCMLVDFVLPGLKEYFGDYSLVSVEERLFEPVIQYDDYNFKGFVDLVVKTSDDKYHIVDWKTCSWGWDTRRKSEKMTTYQLTLYKHFFSLKHNIDSNNVETHFALLKRTAKKNNIEIFKVTSGPKKTENALKLLYKSLYNINNKKHIKNRLACHGKFGTCDYYKTKHCN